MIEKVNPSHPDKLADRIAGALVDRAYEISSNPKIAVEVLLGHGECYIIAETNVHIELEEVNSIVHRIAGENMWVSYKEVNQDEHLSDNQKGTMRCGDNGIFKGVPLTDEQKKLSKIAREIYDIYGSDGKYILDGDFLITCQSNCDGRIMKIIENNGIPHGIINPLGDWTGGTDVDAGATNRKLGSDMADSITGGGLHGKDLSKADVSLNIYAFTKAQETGKVVELLCAIGDETVYDESTDDEKPYSFYIEEARKFINEIGGFEKFAEWGLF